MGTICRKVCISGVPMVLCVISGVAQDLRLEAQTPSPSPSPHPLPGSSIESIGRPADSGHFWILHDNGQRTRISLMRHQFAPRHDARVWVLLCKEVDGQRFAQYVLAGHENCTAQDVSSLMSDTHWMQLVSRIAPGKTTYWKDRIAVARFTSVLAPILVGGATISLMPAGTRTPVQGALIVLAIACVFVASRFAARYFTSRLASVMEGSLTPDIRGQMLEEARMLCEEMVQS